MRAKGRQVTPSEDNQLEKLQEQVLQAEETLTKAPALSLDNVTSEKRRGARQSQALAYNTLPKSLDKQSSIFDILNQDQAIRKEIITNNLDKIGAELSVTQQRALGATLELLHNTGAYRRADEQLEAGQRVKAEEIIVPLQDFYKAYGLDKVINSQGWTDYRGADKTLAIQGLKDLTKPVMQVWGLKKGDGRYKYAEQVYGGLISSVTLTYLDPDDNTYKEILADDPSISMQAKFIKILPSKIFYTRPFIRYPRHLIGKLRDYLKGTNQRLTTTALNIVNMLNLEAHNGSDEIIRDYGTMIAQAGQNRVIEGGKGKYIARKYKDERYIHFGSYDTREQAERALLNHSNFNDRNKTSSSFYQDLLDKNIDQVKTLTRKYS